MPKLKCPSESELNASVKSLWRHVEEDYITTHREASKWSHRSIEATMNYNHDCAKRAAPVLKWLKYQCQQRNLYWDRKAVHLVDHSTDPYTVRPYFVFTLCKPDATWLKVELSIYAPENFDDVRNAVYAAFAALDRVPHQETAK